MSELDHDPECVLLHQLALIRRFECEAGIPVEIEGKEKERPELDGCTCRCEMDAAVVCELPGGGEEKECGGGLGLGLRRTELGESSESKESGWSVRSGKGKTREVTVIVKEVPSWAWGIPRREKTKLETKEGKGDKGKKRAEELEDEKMEIKSC